MIKTSILKNIIMKTVMMKTMEIRAMIIEILIIKTDNDNKAVFYVRQRRMAGSQFQIHNGDGATANMRHTPYYGIALWYFIKRRTLQDFFYLKDVNAV